MKRFKNILYYADGHTRDCAAFQRAYDIARRNNARLTVMDVLQPSDANAEITESFGMDLNQILIDRRKQDLEALIAPFQALDEVIYVQVVTGIGFLEVIRTVIRKEIDLVIKPATMPHGFTQRLFGSNDMHLLRKCPCVVWIDQSADDTSYRQIVAAIDTLDDDCGCATTIIELATSLATLENAALDIVHAWELTGESYLRHGRGRLPPHELDNLLNSSEQQHRDTTYQLTEPFSIDPQHVHIIKGTAVNAIHSLCDELSADLIVMGTVGRTGIPGFFIGNTAEDVLQTTRTAVLAVKPKGFKTPVELPE